MSHTWSWGLPHHGVALPNIFFKKLIDKAYIKVSYSYTRREICDIYAILSV